MDNNFDKNINTEQATISFESLLTKRIYDDVHGFVSLTVDEKELLSHSYMRRLHFIKQNALANFVFPGATHTRFSHSIGVLYIVEKMIQKLKTLGKINITPIDHQVVRLAALLHDVGHYPLSHTIESAFQEYDIYFLQQNKNENPFMGKLNVNNNFFESISKSLDVLKDFSFVSATDSNFHHEKIANVLITDNRSPLKPFVENILKRTYRYTNKKTLGRKELQTYLKLIGKLICGKLNLYDNELLKEKSEQEKYFILSLLINSDLDADQMDYMLRDTKNTGIQTTIRIDFLIDNMDICYLNTSQPVLCFNYRAFESVQQFILSKEYWYTEIILYDKVNILNRIAQRLYMYSLYKEKSINSIDDFYQKILFNEQAYIKFNDSEFWDRMYELDRNQHTDKKLKSLIKIIFGKTKIPRALTGRDLDVITDTKIRSFLKTNVNQAPTPSDEKKYVYSEINRVFKSRYSQITIFPMFFSNKFFKPATAEDPRKDYATRSVYIMLSSCKGNICEKKCENVAGILNTDKLGQNIIHKLLENVKREGARIEKCIIYDFSNVK